MPEGVVVVVFEERYGSDCHPGLLQGWIRTSVVIGVDVFLEILNPINSAAFHPGWKRVGASVLNEKFGTDEHV